jgi:hypothetical protein
MEHNEFLTGPYTWIQLFTKEEIKAIFDQAWEYRLKSMLADVKELQDIKYYNTIDTPPKDGVSIRFKQTSSRRIDWFFVVGKEEIPVGEGLFLNYANITEPD